MNDEIPQQLSNSGAVPTSTLATEALPDKRYNQLKDAIAPLTKFYETASKDIDEAKTTIKAHSRLLNRVQTLTFLGFILIIITVAAVVINLLYNEVQQQNQTTVMLQKLEDKVGVH